MNKLRWVVSGAGLLSMLAALSIPYLFYVNIPCQDDWTLVPIVGNILEGKTTFMDYWSFRSEHHIFFPRLVLSHVAAWTHWNLWLIPWVNLALILSVVYCLYRLSGEFWLPAAFIFSLHAVKMIVWVIQFHTFSSIALSLMTITIVAMDPNPLKRWVAATLCAWIATYSFGMGMVVWFAMAPLLLEAKRSSRFPSILLLWVGSAALSLTIYFWDFPYAQSHPSLPFVFQDPVYTARFFVNYIGAIFYPLPAELFGVIGLIIATWLVVDVYRADNDKRSARLGPLCAILFVLGNGLIISLSRSHYAIEAASVDRYIPVSCIFWAALAVWLTQKRSLRWIPPVLIAALLSTSFYHWDDYRENRKFLVSAVDALKESPPDPNKLRTLFSEEDLVRSSVEVMKKHRLAMFSLDRADNLSH